MHTSIRVRLTFTFIGLAIGPLLAVGIILAWQSYTIQQQQALNLQREMGQRVSTQVTAFFDEIENELRIVSRVQGLTKLDRDKQYSILSELLLYQHVFEELVLLDSQGQERVYVSRSKPTPETLGNRAGADEFIVPKTTGQNYYSSVWLDESSSEPVMIMALPALDVRTGLVDGVLVAKVRIRTIWQLISNVKVNPGQSVYIVDAQGKVVAHRDPSVVLKGTLFDIPDQAGIQPGLTGASAVLATETLRFGEQEFNIVVEQAWSEALALALNTVLITLSLVAAMLIVSGTLGFLSVRQIVWPIQALATTAKAISAGDLSQQAKVMRQDELGILADAFNSMTLQLQGLISGLEQRVTERTAELSRASEQMHDLATQLQTAAEVARAITSILDIDALLPRVVDLIRDRFGYYQVGVALVDESGEWILLRAATGESGRQMISSRERLPVGGQSIVGQVVRTGQPYVAHEVSSDPFYRAHVLLPDTCAEAVFPLLRGEAVVGALDVQSSSPNVFSANALSILAILADQISVAIQNAELHAAAKGHARDLEQAYGSLRENQAKLLIAEKMASLGRLTAGIAHEMNTPLAAVRSALQKLNALAREYGNSIDHPQVTSADHRDIAREMQEAIRLAESAALRAADFVRSIKSQTRDLAPHERQHFNAVPIIHETLLLLDHALRHGGYTANFESADDAVELYGSPGRLAQVITNLVTNAMDAMADKAGGSIDLRLRPQNGHIVFTIRDTGSGISPENLTKIFDPMFTTKPFGQGTGLGLTIVHDIVTGDFNGRIEVLSQPGQGTTFNLYFPLSSMENTHGTPGAN